MLIYCDKSDAQLATFEHDIYMYEFAIKRPGWANLGFLIVKHDKCQEISFDIHFFKDKIDKVNKTIRIPMRPTLRSLNLSNSVSIVVYDILRQKNFEELEEISSYFNNKGMI